MSGIRGTWRAFSVLTVFALILQSFFVLANARPADFGEVGVLCAAVTDDSGSPEGHQNHHR